MLEALLRNKTGPSGVLDVTTNSRTNYVSEYNSGMEFIHQNQFRGNRSITKICNLLIMPHQLFGVVTQIKK